MPTREQILQHLPPFENRRDVIVADQDVADIITGILVKHQQYAKQYDKIAPYFVGANNYETGNNIWNFLKRNVRYKVEPESAQMLKAPAAIVTPYINGQTNTSDCKNLSLFTGGILSAINRAGGRINWCYRFSSYKIWDKIPQHVFVVINPDTNREIWVDAVLPTYNNRKKYYYKTDRKINDMALISLAGTMAGKKRQAKKQSKQQSKESRKEKRKNFFKKLKAKAQKAGKLVLKYNPSTAASRNAFLLLVKVNARSLATNLKKLKDRGNNEVQNTWAKIGGNVAVLNNAIDSGAKKKRLGVVAGISARADRFSPVRNKRSLIRIENLVNPSGKAEVAIRSFVPPAIVPTQRIPTAIPAGGGGYDNSMDDEPITEEIDNSLLENIDDDGNIIGVDPTVTAAAIAAAAPIVAMVVKILSKNKVSSSGDDSNLLGDMTKAGEAAGIDAMAEIDKEAEGIMTPTGDKILEGTKPQPQSGNKLPIMPIVLIGGGILALTLLKKK